MERIFCEVILFCFPSKFPVSCFFKLFFSWSGIPIGKSVAMFSVIVITGIL